MATSDTATNNDENSTKTAKKMKTLQDMIQEEASYYEDKIKELNQQTKSKEGEKKTCDNLIVDYDNQLKQLDSDTNDFTKEMEQQKNDYLAEHKNKMSTLQQDHTNLQTMRKLHQTIDSTIIQTGLESKRLEIVALEESVEKTEEEEEDDGDDEEEEDNGDEEEEEEDDEEEQEEDDGDDEEEDDDGDDDDDDFDGRKMPLMNAPKSANFSKIATDEVHSLTGISKLSQVYKLKRDNIIDFLSWLKLGRGYEKNQEFLDRYKAQKDTKLWKTYCGTAKQKQPTFLVCKQNQTKKELLMRLALYLDLKIDVELDDNCKRILPNNNNNNNNNNNEKEEKEEKHNSNNNNTKRRRRRRRRITAAADEPKNNRNTTIEMDDDENNNNNDDDDDDNTSTNRSSSKRRRVDGIGGVVGVRGNMVNSVIQMLKFR